MDRGICEYFFKCEFYRSFCKEGSRRKRIDLFYEYISLYCYGEMKDHCRHWADFNSGSFIEKPKAAPNGLRIIFSADRPGQRQHD